MSWKESVTIFDQIVQASSFSERKGKKMIYTSANGYMYAIVNADGDIGFRLSKDEQKLFGETFELEPLLSHGAVMRDYVKAPGTLLREVNEAALWLDRAHNYAMSLPQKKK